jgi:hypothetical protein
MLLNLATGRTEIGLSDLKIQTPDSKTTLMLYYAST